MASVDLNLYRFDFDLTLAILLMHPDGTVYHRLGSRPKDDPDAWLSSDVLADLLNRTLGEHKKHKPVSRKGRKTVRRINDIPAWRKRTGGKPPKCVHCHMVHTAERLELQRKGKWKREDMWMYPEPKLVGLQIDPNDQTLITHVRKGSLAQKAGLEADDRIETASGVPVATINDFQWQLHQLKSRSARLPMTIVRKGKSRKFTLPTKKGWRVTDPADYAWRAYKWELKPQPGFGGPVLDEDEKKRLGLSGQKFAFRVGYLVTWGPNAASGRNAQSAGIKKGDVIVSVDGKDDFESIEHFHAWFRLTREPGSTADVRVLRSGRLRRIKLPVRR